MNGPIHRNVCFAGVAGQYLRFCMVGGSGVVVDMLLLHFLAAPSCLGWDLTLSKILAAEVAMFSNFLWNDRWTFGGAPRFQDQVHSWWGRLARFNLICTAGIGLSTVLLNLQVHMLDLNLYLSNGVAILVASVWNFVLARHYGWGAGAKREAREGMLVGSAAPVARPQAAGWRRVLAGLVVLKITYFALLVGALSIWGDFDELTAEVIRRGWFPEPQAQWLEQLQVGWSRYFTTWDAAHYLVLSEEGYTRGLKSCAFYPLWPILIRGTALAIGIGPLATGVLLANVLSLAGWVLFWSTTCRRFGEPAANAALAFLITFPGALFYQFGYSESLFFLLLMVLWHSLERERFGLAGMAAFLLPLTRAVGIFAFLPILWHGVIDRRNRERRSLGANDPRSDAASGRLRFGVRAILCHGSVATIFALLLGWAAYFALMRAWTGNAWEGFAAQRLWKAHSISNLWNVPGFVMEFFEPTSWHQFQGSALDRLGFLVLAATLPFIWHLGRDLFMWACVLGGRASDEWPFRFLCPIRIDRISALHRLGSPCGKGGPTTIFDGNASGHGGPPRVLGLAIRELPLGGLTIPADRNCVFFRQECMTGIGRARGPRHQIATIRSMVRWPGWLAQDPYEV